MNISHISKQKWYKIAAIFSVLAGGCSGWLAWVFSDGRWDAFVAAAFLGGFFAGVLIVLLGSTNLKLNFLRGQIRESHTSLREITNIRPLLDGPPLDYGNWAVDPFLGKILAQFISRYEPNHILECGSGTSTVLMRQLQQRVKPSGTVTSLEHLPEYAKKSEQLLSDHSLSDSVEIVLAPLEKWDIEGKAFKWYSVDPDRFADSEIDMLIVDGPPHSIGPLARYPAAFVLEPHLSENCVVIMDDGDRPDEKKAAHRWAELLGAELEYVGGPKGTYVLHR